MKELSIEQKARAYDDAKARMSRAFNTNRCTIGFMNEIFPELKESSDEEISLEIRNFIWGYPDKLPERDKWLAWFKKQFKKESDPRYKYLEELRTADDIYQMAMNDVMVEEAKSKAINALSNLNISKLLGLEKQSKKLEPKFHPGDWIIDNNFGNTYQIETATEIEPEHIFGYTIVGGGYFNDNSDVRLWTINDAKDGDVLCYENKNDFKIFIYKNGHIHYHCCYSNGYLTPIDSFFVVPKYLLCYIHPATKEQRDLLFQKMNNMNNSITEKKYDINDYEV